MGRDRIEVGGAGGIRLRQAGESDLAEIRGIWLENEIAQLAQVPTHQPSPSCFRHQIETGEMWVAERGGRLVGFTAILPRHNFVYLAEMFVRPRVQSGGVGTSLLACVTPGDGREFWALSSTDPRAHTLYLRAGMRPKWPRYTLLAQATDVASEVTLAQAREIEVVEADEGDPEFLRFDREIGGFFDQADHVYWIGERAAVPLWFRRNGERIGYGYVQMRDDESFQHPDALVIGPLGSLRQEDAADCAAAAAAWACERAEVVQIAIPGRHPALAPFVEAGFQIIYVETFFSSAEPPFNGFDRYLL